MTSDVNTLRAAINTEIAAWNAWLTSNSQSAKTGGLAAMSVGDTITFDDTLASGVLPQINVLNLALAQIDLWSAYNAGQIGSGGYPGAAQATTKVDGGQASNPGINVGSQLITAAQWQAIISSYNTITQDCICNSDCACNAVCACYNDCACNYSDERLKTNIILVDVIDEINVYEFNYAWNPTKRYRGVLAQELLNTKYNSAVTKDDSGFYMVDYALLPVKMEELSLCTA
jgi:hypothetical protein